MHSGKIIQFFCCDNAKDKLQQYDFQMFTELFTTGDGSATCTVLFKKVNYKKKKGFILTSPKTFREIVDVFQCFVQ